MAILADTSMLFGSLTPWLVHKNFKEFVISKSIFSLSLTYIITESISL